MRIKYLSVSGGVNFTLYKTLNKYLANREYKFIIIQTDLIYIMKNILQLLACLKINLYFCKVFENVKKQAVEYIYSLCPIL